MNKKYIFIFAIGLSCLASCHQDDSQLSSTPTIEFQSLWPETVAEDINEVLHYDIPFYDTAILYESNIFLDDYGDPLLEIYCTLKSEEESLAEDIYYNLCEDSGFFVEQTTVHSFDPETFVSFYYDVFYASKAISDTIGIELQFLVSMRNGSPCLGIFGYTYVLVDPLIWPSELIISLLGFDIPHLYREGLTYSATLEIDVSTQEPYAYILIENAVFLDETNYTLLLEKNNYAVFDQDYAEYGYMAYDEAYTHCIQYKFNEGEQNIIEMMIWAL